MIDVLAFRPCGACRAYVPVDAGCAHWVLADAEEAKRRRRNERQRATRAARDELIRQLRLARA